MVIRNTADAEEARRAEIAYHKKQNMLVIYTTLPSMFLYCCFYFYISHFFQFFIFVLMISNSISALFISNRFKKIQSLVLYKRVAAGIWFGLLATSLLTGLWDKTIYYIVVPWIFLYPIAVIMFIGRRLGFIVGVVFSMVALIFFLVNEIPPLNSHNIILFKFNAALSLLSILLICVIYEKNRMKVQDELAISENQYKLAEMRQRETNIELQKEIERRWDSEKALAESELHYRALFEESVVPLWEEDWSQVKILLDRLSEEERNHLENYFENHPEVIDTFIHVIQISAVNRATLKLCETDSETFLLQNMRKLISADIPSIIVRRIVSIYQTGRYDAELLGTTIEGNERHLLVSSTIPAGYKNSWGKIFSSVYDITERITIEKEKKRVEQRLQNAREIQAVATLAGGIAHQFNNALAVIFASLDLLEMNARKEPENQKYLTSLKSSAARMSRLTDQLLAYAEGGKYQPQIFSLNELVKDILGSKIMMRDSAIDVVTDLSEDICWTTGDITQIRMVVEVILSNAFEALPQGGRVRITSGRKAIDPSLTERTIKTGLYVYILVEDNGIGMTNETLSRIFEPFFTTKIFGRGLGMAAAFGIINNHDGVITVESESGKGTTVAIYLPAAQQSGTQLLYSH